MNYGRVAERLKARLSKSRKVETSSWVQIPPLPPIINLQNKNMPIPWTPELSVGVEEIDHQHQIFLGILNSLYEIVYKAERKKELVNILRQIEAYAIFHFATEEKYFDKFDYELAEGHKKKHAELLESVLKFKERYVAEGEEVLAELIGFLEDWLVDHLAKEDKKYTQCFNSHGLF